MSDSEQVGERTIERLRQLDPAHGSVASELIQRERIRSRALAQLASGSHSESPQLDRESRAHGSRAVTRRPRRRLALGIGGSLALVAGIVVALLLGGSSVGPGSDHQFAEAAIRIAEQSPRLVVGEPGWKVTHVDQLESDSGRTDFRLGDQGIDIDWNPEQFYGRPDLAALRKDPANSEEHYEKFTALGEEGVLSSIPGRSLYELVLPPRDGIFIQIYSDPRRAMTKERFLEIVESIHDTDIDSWLAALPRDVVKPVDHRATVDGMLEGLPVPDDVDVERLRDEDLAADRYQVGARVSGAIACGWLDQWADAVHSGDEASATEAIDAMATARDWPILKEMAPQGGWSQTVWGYAHDIRVDDREHLLGSAGTMTLADGRTYEMGPGYASGLGCDSETYTLRPDN